MVETDARYLRYGDDRHSTLAVIGMIAAKLKKVHGSDWRALLNITRMNTKRLYGQHLPPALDLSVTVARGHVGASVNSMVSLETGRINRLKSQLLAQSSVNIVVCLVTGRVNR